MGHIREAWERLAPGGKGQGSLKGLAEQVLARWQELEPGAVYNANSLATKLGALDAGRDAGWWKRRPAAAQALAEVLDVEVADLAIESTVAAAAGLYGSPEFPGLRPLDAREEQPPALGRLVPLDGRSAPASDTLSDWFAQALHAFRVPDNALVEMAPGTGRGLTSHWHEIRSPHVEVVRAGTLAEAARAIRGDGATLLCVARAEPSEDLRALNRLGARRRAGVLVLYPGRLELDAPRGLRTVPGEAGEGERTFMRLAWGWRRYRWTLAEGWQRSLLGWVAARLPEGDTLFEVEAMTAALERLATQGLSPASPSELLGLCRHAHHFGERELLRVMDSDGRVLLNASTAGDDDEWLRASGVDAALAMLRARLFRLDCPLDEALAFERWAELIPADLLPPPRLDDYAGEHGAAIAAERDPAECQRRVGELLDAVTRRPGRQVVEKLRSAGLLRALSGTRLEFFPRWVARLVTRRAIESSLDRPREWGALCLDAARRRRVDEVLRSLTDEAFVGCLAGALASFDAKDVASVAAVETLFAAAAARLATGWQPGALGLALAEAQAASLRSLPGFGPAPSTRLDRGRRHEDLADSLADLWTWALRAPESAAALSERVSLLAKDLGDTSDPFAWLFTPEEAPAPWFLPFVAGAPALASLPSGLMGLAAAKGGDDPTAATARLLGLAEEVLDRVDPAELALRAEQLPDFLLPGALLALLRTGQALSDGLLERFWAAGWLWGWLDGRVRERHDVTLGGLARLVWLAAARAWTAPDQEARPRLPWLWTFLPTRREEQAALVATHLEEGALVEGWERYGASAACAFAWELRPALRAAVIRRAAQGSDEELRALFPVEDGLVRWDLFSPAELPALLELGRARADYAGLVAWLTWQLDPTRALATAAEAWAGRTSGEFGIAFWSRADYECKLVLEEEDRRRHEEARPDAMTGFPGLWFESAPLAATEGLLAALEAHPAAVPPMGLYHWALDRLPDSGALAPRLFALTRIRPQSQPS